MGGRHKNTAKEMDEQCVREDYRKSSIKPRGAYLFFTVLEGDLIERGLNREGA